MKGGPFAKLPMIAVPYGLLSRGRRAPSHVPRNRYRHIVGGVYASARLVHPDPAIRKANLERLKKIRRRLGLAHGIRLRIGHIHPLAGRGREGRRPWHDRLAGLPKRKPEYP